MGYRLNLKPLIGACGKRRLYTMREAERAKLELERKQERGDVKPGRLGVYFCNRCSAYHCGHDRRGNR